MKSKEINTKTRDFQDLPRAMKAKEKIEKEAAFINFEKNIYVHEEQIRNVFGKSGAGKTFQLIRLE